MSSCSIGACRFIYPQALHDLMAASDQLLYQAKHKGKGRYVIAPDPPEKSDPSPINE